MGNVLGEPCRYAVRLSSPSKYSPSVQADITLEDGNRTGRLQTAGLGSLRRSSKFESVVQSDRHSTSASKELDSRKHHTIVPDGYNLGRDWFVERAVQGSNWKGRWWAAEVEWRKDLLPEGNDGAPEAHCM